MEREVMELAEMLETEGTLIVRNTLGEDIGGTEPLIRHIQ
jgi:hypothetical protein